jgi:subtilisin family serine protease
MNTTRRTAPAACGILLLLCTVAPAAAAPDAVSGYASTHVIVRAAEGVVPARQGVLAPTLDRFGVTAIRPVFENGFANPQLARELGLDRYYRVKVPEGTDTVALTAELSRFPDQIERAEIDGAGGVATTTPDDTDFDLQWGMMNSGQEIGGVAGLIGADINMTEGWDFSTGDPDLVMAVLDAGMDVHVEIADRLVPGRNVAAEPDNDDISDVCISHGTHVAGIAAANANNAAGVAGVDWACRIMPVKVLLACNGLESYVAEGIIWATDHGADVINMSLQYGTGSQVLHDAVLYAYGQGKVMIAAAGNNTPCASPFVKYPAHWPETIAVAAFNNVGERASFSNCGPELDVSAPGENIWSLNNTTQYKYLDGTSMAAPHVSGVASLMKSYDPDLTPDEIKSILQTTAIDIGDPGFDDETGWGRIDAEAALQVVAAPVLADLDRNGVVDVSDFLLLLAAWGPCPPGDSCSGDIDRDGFVGVSDFLLMLSVWD